METERDLVIVTVLMNKNFLCFELLLSPSPSIPPPSCFSFSLSSHSSVPLLFLLSSSPLFPPSLSLSLSLSLSPSSLYLFSYPFPSPSEEGRV